MTDPWTIVGFIVIGFIILYIFAWMDDRQKEREQQMIDKLYAMKAELDERYPHDHEDDKR